MATSTGSSLRMIDFASDSFDSVGEKMDLKNMHFLVGTGLVPSQGVQRGGTGLVALISSASEVVLVPTPTFLGKHSGKCIL